MPVPLARSLQPHWSTHDGQLVRLYCGDVLYVLKRMPSGSVHTACTSPPYWGLRSYATGDQKHLELGSERVPDCLGWAKGENCAETDWANACYVCRMVLVFRELRRVLRDDGVLWLNLGDTYGPQGLYCIPWKTAQALQTDGWLLRSDLPWVKRCLSGGTKVYARTQKGDMPMGVKDLVRLSPETVKLWNGSRWTQVKGFAPADAASKLIRARSSKTVRRQRRRGDDTTPLGDLEIEFRSGERVGCTREHLWPTARGVIRSDQLTCGDIVPCVKLPEPDLPLRPPLLDDLTVGWVVGFYVAEGNQAREDHTIFSVHQDEESTAFPRIRDLAEALGDTCRFRRRSGKGASIVVCGRIFPSLMREYVSGDSCYNKTLTTKAWQRSNDFLRAVAEGYLEGDGRYEEGNDRWRFGFCKNDRWASNLRTLAARVGSRVRLRRKVHYCEGKAFPGWKGEWRFNIPSKKAVGRGGIPNENGEVVAIRSARSRKFWDIEVEDAPNLFCLASGLMTHNSPMPESITNRPAKALENVFMLVKKPGYYFDMEAVKPQAKLESEARYSLSFSNATSKGLERTTTKAGNVNRINPYKDGKREFTGLRNFRNADLWYESIDTPHGLTGLDDELVGLDVTPHGWPGAHFATFPKQLVEPLIKAGSSERGCCAECGSPWRRLIDKSTRFEGGSGKAGRTADEVNAGGKWAGKQYGDNLKLGPVVESQTLGWEPTCTCHGRFEKRTVKVAVKCAAKGSDVPRGWDCRLGVGHNTVTRSSSEGLDADLESRQQDIGSGRTVTKTETVYVPDLPLDEHPVVPCMVMDPFLGSGTTCCVAIALGRRSVGIDLSREYLDVQAIPRIESVVAEYPALSHLVGPRAVRLLG